MEDNKKISELLVSILAELKSISAALRCYDAPGAQRSQEVTVVKALGEIAYQLNSKL